jgi:hypothetical protein
MPDSTPDFWEGFNLGDDEGPSHMPGEEPDLPQDEASHLAHKLAEELDVTVKHVEYLAARTARLAAMARALATRLKPSP